MKTEETTLKVPTLEDFSHTGENIHDAVALAKSYYGEYPAQIEMKKPRLGPKPSPEEARIWADDMSKYAELEKVHAIAVKEYQQHSAKVNEVLELHMKEESGFNRIPEQYKAKVWSKAWNDGHSEGYTNVYFCLLGLVEIFE